MRLFNYLFVLLMIIFCWYPITFKRAHDVYIRADGLVIFYGYTRDYITRYTSE